MRTKQIKIRHTITVSANGIETTHTLIRAKRLTYAGAQRILKKSGVDCIVTRIETAIQG